MNKIIGIFGQMENGKTTFARMIHEDIGLLIKGFAVPVKQLVCEYFGVSMADIEHMKSSPVKLPGWNVTMREALQIVGNNLRDIKSRVWIDKAIESPCIIDDGRYENEAKAIRDVGGYNILIIRPDKLNESNHPSETWVGSMARLALKRHTEKLTEVSFTDIEESVYGASVFNSLILNAGTENELAKIAKMEVSNICQHLFQSKG